MRGRQRNTGRARSTRARCGTVSTWAERYRPVWERRLARMEDYLARLAVPAGGGEAERGHEDAVVIDRSFAAPIEVVWRMWTTAERSRRGTGRGRRVTSRRLDVRVGGARRVCMEVETPAGDADVVHR